jgi:hypothetical protein
MFLDSVKQAMSTLKKNEIKKTIILTQCYLLILIVVAMHSSSNRAPKARPLLASALLAG